MKKIKQLLLSASAALALVMPVAVAPLVAAQADIQNSVCNGSSLDVTGGGGGCAATTADGTNANNLIKNIINIFSIIVGVISVIMIIIGGFRYITSGGDSNAVSSAKNTILYAIIGLIIVVFAQIIVRFVLNKVTVGA